MHSTSMCHLGELLGAMPPLPPSVYGPDITWQTVEQIVTDDPSLKTLLPNAPIRVGGVKSMKLVQSVMVSLLTK